MKEGKKSKFGPTGPWFRMPRELTLSSELNPYQYRMLSIMLERDDLHQSTKNHDRFWSYTEWLVSHSGMGRTKAKETLNEIEEMGLITKTSGKNKRRANIFRINWDFINAYKAPNTRDDELEDMEEPDIQEEPEVQEAVQTVSVSMPRDDYETEAFDASEEEVPYDEAQDYPDEEVMEDYEVDMSEEEPEKSHEPTYTSLPTAQEWFRAEGKRLLYERAFPYLLSSIPPGSDNLSQEAIENTMAWVMPLVAEDDKFEVWKTIILPEFYDYHEANKKEKHIQA